MLDSSGVVEGTFFLCVDAVEGCQTDDDAQNKYLAEEEICFH